MNWRNHADHKSETKAVKRALQALEQAQARVKTRPSGAECPCCGTRLVMLGDGDLVTWEEAVDDDPETFKDP